MRVKALFSNLFYVSKLSLQSVKVLAQANYQRQKAKKTFHKTLILNEIPLEIAKELTQAYPNPIKEIVGLLKIRRRQLN